MTRYEIDRELALLCQELSIAQSMDEESAQRAYNVDCKAERISAIEKEIEFYENSMRELDECENRDLNYCRTADKPYLCW